MMGKKDYRLSWKALSQGLAQRNSLLKIHRRLIRSCCQILAHWSLSEKRVIALQQTIGLKPSLKKARWLAKEQKESKIICFSKPPVLTLYHPHRKDSLNVRHRHDLLPAGCGGVPTALKEQLNAAKEHPNLHLDWEIRHANLNNTDSQVPLVCSMFPVSLKYYIYCTQVAAERDPAAGWQ